MAGTATTITMDPSTAPVQQVADPFADPEQAKQLAGPKSSWSDMTWKERIVGSYNYGYLCMVSGSGLQVSPSLGSHFLEVATQPVCVPRCTSLQATFKPSISLQQAAYSLRAAMAALGWGAACFLRP